MYKLWSCPLKASKCHPRKNHLQEYNISFKLQPANTDHHAVIAFLLFLFYNINTDNHNVHTNPCIHHSSNLTHWVVEVKVARGYFYTFCTYLFHKILSNVMRVFHKKLIAIPTPQPLKKKKESKTQRENHPGISKTVPPFMWKHHSFMQLTLYLDRANQFVFRQSKSVCI